MALIASERVQKWLRRTYSGLLVERTYDGKLHWVAKVPARTMKALTRGVDAEFCLSVFDVDGAAVTFAAFAVHDEPGNPFFGVRPLFDATDAEFVEQALTREMNTLHCFDELLRPVLSADVSYDAAIAAEVAAEVRREGGFVAEESRAIIERALDLFEKRLHGESDEGCRVFRTFPVSLANIRTINHVTVTDTEALDPFRIDDSAEGSGFEQSVHEMAEQVYGRDAHRSPQVTRGTKSRELTDIFLTGYGHVCLIEAKALAMLGGAATSERQAANMEKDLAKAFDQLPGAAKWLREGTLTTKDGAPLSVTPFQLEIVHGIVLVSEMIPAVDWQRVATTVRELHRKRDLFVNVVDLLELQNLFNGAEGSADDFSRILVNRWQRCLEENFALARMRFW